MCGSSFSTLARLSGIERRYSVIRAAHMPGKANLSIMDQRRASRHQIDVSILGHHRRLGDMRFRLINISTDGFMAADVGALGRGDRVMIRLQVAGYVEAFCLWTADDRAGFQFERPIRKCEFPELLGLMQKRAHRNSHRVGMTQRGNAEAASPPVLDGRGRTVCFRPAER